MRNDAMMSESIVGCFRNYVVELCVYNCAWSFFGVYYHSCGSPKTGFSNYCGKVMDTYIRTKSKV
jgi:hypothetical protein